MPNINKDFILELVLETPQYNKRFEILPQERKIVFFKDDRSQPLYLLVHGWKEEGLTLKLAIANAGNPKHIMEYYPELLGQQEGQDTHIFKIDLSNEILANPNKYEMQAFILSDNAILSSNISSFKVKSCL